MRLCSCRRHRDEVQRRHCARSRMPLGAGKPLEVSDTAVMAQVRHPRHALVCDDPHFGPKACFDQTRVLAWRKLSRSLARRHGRAPCVACDTIEICIKPRWSGLGRFQGDHLMRVLGHFRLTQDTPPRSRPSGNQIASAASTTLSTRNPSSRSRSSTGTDRSGRR